MVVLGGPAGAAHAQAGCADADSNAGLSTFQLEAAIACLIIQDRAAAGVAPLTADAQLQSAARDHAADMVTRHYFDYNSPTGETPKERAVRFSYGNGALGIQVGTLVAFGGGPTATPRAIFESMKSDPSQLAVIRNPLVRDFAAGAVRGAPVAAGSDAATYAIYFGSLAQAVGPVFGKSVAGEEVAGAVSIAIPGGNMIPLDGVASLPFGSRVNTTTGTLQIAAASSPSGGVQNGEVQGGQFTIVKTKGSGPFTELKLTVPKRCKGKRKLVTNSNGRFRTNGKYAIAAGIGASWITEDTCAGTRITVTRGTVSVRDKRTNKARNVTAGHSVLVRAKKKS